MHGHNIPYGLQHSLMCLHFLYQNSSVQALILSKSCLQLAFRCSAMPLQVPLLVSSQTLGYVVANSCNTDKC